MAKTIKFLLILFIVSQGILAVEAPYLISAQALSDSTVKLVWRNNDITTLGYILQRKGTGGIDFQTIDTIKQASSIDSCVDKKDLLPVSQYVYRIFAYNTGSVSIASNEVQVTTLNITPVFKKPFFSALWDWEGLKFNQLSFSDSSNCEIGFDVFRSDGIPNHYSLVARYISYNPKTIGMHIWRDSGVTVNNFYYYYVSIFNGTDTLKSDTLVVYAFNNAGQNKIVRFSKKAEFPISLSTWSAKSGDSIILKETSSSAGKFSVINIADPSKPSFAGYIDSVSLLAYPWESLIPAFLKFGVYNNYYITYGTYPRFRVALFNGTIYYASKNILCSYRLKDGKEATIDTMGSDYSFDNYGILTFGTNQHLMVFKLFKFGSYEHIVYQRYYILNDTSIKKYPQYQFYYWGNGNIEGAERMYEHGIIENKIVMSMRHWTTDWTNIPNEIHRDMFSLQIQDTLSGSSNEYRSESGIDSAFNTGYYLSDSLNLCLEWPFLYYSQSNHPTKLFFVDPNKFNSRTVAEQNGAVYVDSINKLDNLRNILLDTAHKYIYLFYTNKLVSLSYDTSNQIGILSPSKTKNSSQKSAMVMQCSQGVMILFPSLCKNIDARFYDLSGRLVDKITSVNTNAVLWKPKGSSLRSYIAVIKNGTGTYAEKIIVK